MRILSTKKLTARRRKNRQRPGTSMNTSSRESRAGRKPERKMTKLECRMTKEFHGSADFQVCCIAGFQTRHLLYVQRSRKLQTPGRFGNRRYGSVGKLRSQ